MPGATGRNISSRLAEWMQPFRGAFTAPTWQHVIVLVMGAILVPGRRSVASALRVDGVGPGPDNARYHHAKLVQAWLARPVCRIRLHFVPAYCLHLNPIERLWGLMHRHITHNKCYATFKDFSIAMLSFLRDDVPKNWRTYCDQVTDNFRVINPTEFRIIA